MPATLTTCHAAKVSQCVWPRKSFMIREASGDVAVTTVACPIHLSFPTAVSEPYFSSKSIARVNKGKSCPITCRADTEERHSVGVPILDPGARTWWLISATPRPLYPRERGQVRIGQESGWASGPV
jgi:hypothetical protein